jgi:hypothetical protein
MVRRGDVFVVRDSLVSTNEHTYDFCLHSEGVLSLDRTLSAPQPGSGIAWVSNLVQAASVRVLSGKWTESGVGVRFWLAGTGDVTPMTGECPAETGARRIPMLIARQKGTTVEFVAVLAPEPSDADGDWRRAISEARATIDSSR